MTLIVTGANGFVGREVVRRAREAGHDVRAVVRTAAGPGGDPGEGDGTITVGSIDDNTEWSTVMAGVTTVVHCAARVHRMKDHPDELDQYRLVNAVGTVRLAEAAAAAGARRLVFVSSIKVSGDWSEPGRPLSPDTVSRPTDPYGRSKAEAEGLLRDLTARTGLEVVIVRPPLVYGPGAKGNIERLLRLVRSRVPLPLGSVQNRRSIVGLANLADFLLTTAEHPAAAGQTFVVADDGVVSTPEVVRILARASGVSSMLVPVPLRLLRTTFRVLGREGAYRRLTGDLEVDASLCSALLGWHPPFTAEQSIASAALTGDVGATR